MKLNKRGMTMVEVITSVALVSIVLVFMMNLFLRVRRVYNTSKIASNYQILVSNVIKEVSEDIANYGVKSIGWANESNHTILKIEYKRQRPTYTSEYIVKYLKVTEDFISYGYDETLTTNLTADEKLTNMVRSIPEDAILNLNDEYIVLHTNDSYGLFKIVIPLADSNSNVYNINIAGYVK